MLAQHNAADARLPESSRRARQPHWITRYFSHAQEDR